MELDLGPALTIRTSSIGAMARPLRIQYPGALYHVTSRGNARASIYADDGDRRRFLDVLGEVVESYRWCCQAYCLMPNHYHLVVETPQANLSRGMRHLNGLYTQRYNRHRSRVGHVFQGRFKGILVERESHLLELVRYVVLNPVRAGIVEAAENYAWSSLRATLRLAPAPSWLLSLSPRPESPLKHNVKTQDLTPSVTPPPARASRSFRRRRPAPRACRPGP